MKLSDLTWGLDEWRSTGATGQSIVYAVSKLDGRVFEELLRVNVNEVLVADFDAGTTLIAAEISDAFKRLRHKIEVFYEMSGGER